MSLSRRVLLLSYYVPPRVGVATTRTRQLLRYLPEFGWEVTAVTPQLEGAPAQVIQTGYFDVQRFVKRMVGLGNRSTHAVLGTAPPSVETRKSIKQRAVALGFAVTAYPDAQVGWFGGGRTAVRSLLARGQYDVVLSSAPPMTTNLILASLKLSVPWIADFRDLWSDGDYSGSAIRNMLDSALERWTLGKVACVTTITEKMRDVITSHRPGTRAEVIPNAFDPEEWEQIPFASEARTTFVHAGQLFAGQRDPRPLFRAVRALIDRGMIAAQEVQIDLYGTAESWLQHEIAELRLEDVVNVHGSIPRRNVLEAERRADRLLVLLWDSGNTEGIVTGKIFEYLGAGRSILAVGGPERSAVDRVLDDTHAGVRCRDQASLEREVLQAVTEHRENRIRVLQREFLRNYEAQTMAKRFADVFERCLAR